ncbi:unnamed protein product [Cunninghamella blakesleeana]
MLPKLILIASTALLAVSAQNQTATKWNFAGYPQPGAKPTPKAEWMEIVNKAGITGSPVPLKNGEPDLSGVAESACDWTQNLCTGPDDIVACPKGQWGITYDDGPTANSPKLYDYLKQVNQKSTLFLIGGQVTSFPDLTERAFKEGHELAIHTWTHSYLTTLSNEQIVAELMWTASAIKEVTGFTPRFYRPPYGDIDNRVRNIAKALGFTAVIWNHDTDDWRSQEDKGFDVKWIDGNATAWAKEAATATVGGISLEHDLYPKTVDAAIRILPVLQKAYKVTTVGQCTGQQSYKEGNGPASNATTTPSASASASASGSATNKPSSGSNADAKPSNSNSSQQKGENAAGRVAINSALVLVGAGIASMLI